MLAYWTLLSACVHAQPGTKFEQTCGQDLRLFYVWDCEGDSTSKDAVTEQFFEGIDREPASDDEGNDSDSSDSSGGRKKKRGKKDKKKSKRGKKKGKKQSRSSGSSTAGSDSESGSEVQPNLPNLKLGIYTRLQLRSTDVLGKQVSNLCRMEKRRRRIKRRNRGSAQRRKRTSSGRSVSQGKS